MTTIDMTFCSELIRTVGARIHETSKQNLRLSTFEEIFAEIQAMNTWVIDTLRAEVSVRYPSIPWSDSELDVDQQQQAEYAREYWICDPLDGALHYIQGFALYAFSLCLVRDGKPAASFVYDPCSQELFHAVAGEGAYLNGQPIHVSQKKGLANAYVTTSLPSRPAEDAESAELTVRGIAQVMPKAMAVKMLGSVSLQLAYVACGKLDGYWEFGSHYYDWLAGALLVQEAGGTVSDSKGNPFTWGTSGIIASHREVFDQLSAELKGIQA
ncbi:inositol monophosphatase family protein [Paenibacillus filicis]|uniref:Inositol monophosphatase family protein n=1 Tax=Paenibacillus filicis TaxID=669464 RepID=A0ABU9DJK8_9BACL